MNRKKVITSVVLVAASSILASAYARQQDNSEDSLAETVRSTLAYQLENSRELAKAGNKEQAVSGLLDQLAFYDQAEPLAAEAYVLASNLLGELGRDEQAQAVVQEALQRFRHIPWANDELTALATRYGLAKARGDGVPYTILRFQMNNGASLSDHTGVLADGKDTVIPAGKDAQLTLRGATDVGGTDLTLYITVSQGSEQIVRQYVNVPFEQLTSGQYIHTAHFKKNGVEIELSLGLGYGSRTKTRELVESASSPNPAVEITDATPRLRRLSKMSGAKVLVDPSFGNPRLSLTKGSMPLRDLVEQAASQIDATVVPILGGYSLVPRPKALAAREQAEPVATKGFLPKDAIQNVIRGYRDQVAACYEDVLNAVGKVGVDTVAGPDPKRISIDLKEADLSNVLRLIAQVSGQNIVGGKEIDDVKVTIALKNVQWNVALRQVLRTHGLDVMVEDDILRVVPEVELGPTGRVAFRWQITPNGSVDSVVVTKRDFESWKLEDCVSKIISSMQFPNPEGGGVVTVNYPFAFTSWQ